MGFKGTRTTAQEIRRRELGRRSRRTATGGSASAEDTPTGLLLHLLMLGRQRRASGHYSRGGKCRRAATSKRALITIPAQISSRSRKFVGGRATESLQTDALHPEDGTRADDPPSRSPSRLVLLIVFRRICVVYVIVVCWELES